MGVKVRDHAPPEEASMREGAKEMPWAANWEADRIALSDMHYDEDGPHPK